MLGAYIALLISMVGGVYTPFRELHLRYSSLLTATGGFGGWYNKQLGKCTIAQFSDFLAHFYEQLCGQGFSYVLPTSFPSIFLKHSNSFNRTSCLNVTERLKETAFLLMKNWCMQEKINLLLVTYNTT